LNQLGTVCIILTRQLSFDDYASTTLGAVYQGLAMTIHLYRSAFLNRPCREIFELVVLNSAASNKIWARQIIVNYSLQLASETHISTGIVSC